MKDLSRPERGLRLNWTVAEAGPFRNVVPARATAQGDVRALRMADFDALRAAMAEKLRNKLLPDSRIHLSFELRRPPLVASDAARALARRAQAIYRDELGRLNARLAAVCREVWLCTAGIARRLK